MKLKNFFQFFRGEEPENLSTDQFLRILRILTDPIDKKIRKNFNMKNTYEILA